MEFPEPNTEQEEKILEILTAKIETDEDYQKLGELTETPAGMINPKSLQ